MSGITWFACLQRALTEAFPDEFIYRGHFYYRRRDTGPGASYIKDYDAIFRSQSLHLDRNPFHQTDLPRSRLFPRRQIFTPIQQYATLEFGFLILPAVSSISLAIACLLYPWTFFQLAQPNLVLGSFVACIILLFLPLVTISAMNPLLVALRAGSQGGSAKKGTVVRGWSFSSAQPDPSSAYG